MSWGYLRSLCPSLTLVIESKGLSFSITDGSKRGPRECGWTQRAII
jgi:hypothetical protein